MFLAIGIKKAFKIIWQYPTLILAPVFSIWTLGPVLISIGKRKCLKISLLLTWGNFFHNYRRNFVFRVFLLFQENWYSSLLSTYATNNCLFNIVPHFRKLVYTCDITKVRKFMLYLLPRQMFSNFSRNLFRSRESIWIDSMASTWNGSWS